MSPDTEQIQKVDKKFKTIGFGGVPVMSVFTKFKKLRSAIDWCALEVYTRDRGIDDEVMSIVAQLIK